MNQNCYRPCDDVEGDVTCNAASSLLWKRSAISRWQCSKVHRGFISTAPIIINKILHRTYYTINLRCSRVFLHLSMTKGGVKLPPSVSQDLRHLGMKFQRLPPCFRGRGTQWRYREGSIFKPEVRNSRWRLPNRKYLYLSFRRCTTLVIRNDTTEKIISGFTATILDYRKQLYLLCVLNCI